MMLRTAVGTTDLAARCSRCGTTTAADPMVASGQRCLATQGRSPALIAGLQRCPACAGSEP